MRKARFAVASAVMVVLAMLSPTANATRVPVSAQATASQVLSSQEVLLDATAIKAANAVGALAPMRAEASQASVPQAVTLGATTVDLWNDQGSWWPVQARVDYFNGPVTVYPGTWAYWIVQGYEKVNSAYNGYGSCLRTWYLDGSGWHPRGYFMHQGAWWIIGTANARVGVTALPLGPGTSINCWS